MTATTIRYIDVDGHVLRIALKPGEGTPLLVFNGLGANLELLQPFTEALEGIPTIVFDVPGVGGSSCKLLPYRLRSLAMLAHRMLERLGHAGPVDALGISWGGALAQQFALTCRSRCRKLVLAATSPGIVMVPGSAFVLAYLVSPWRYDDASHLQRVGPLVYGGPAWRDPRLVQDYAARLMRPSWLGYLHQQLAIWGWSSLPWLPLLRQPTLVLAGKDDPLVPVLNACILAWLIPGARLRLFDDGHLFLVTDAQRAASCVGEFLSA